VRGYKLFRELKNGDIASLFINKKARHKKGMWLDAECYPTKGFAVRKGWHCCAEPSAPHLSKKDRVWLEVEMDGVKEFSRPKSQGGLWYLADKIKIVELEPKLYCSICDSEYDEDAGGIQGYFGIMPVTFCCWCYSSIVDMVGLFYEDEMTKIK